MSFIEKCYIEFETNSSGDVDYKKAFRSMEYLIEQLTFADSHEIFELLEKKKKEDLLGIPFWFRTLAYHLLILKNPRNKEYLNNAYRDLQMFGSEWELETEKYLERLSKLG